MYLSSLEYVNMYMPGVHTEFFAGGGHITKFRRHIGIA